MAVPAHQRCHWVGTEAVSVSERVPYGAQVKVIREMPNNKFRVRVMPGQKLKEQEFEAFREELVFV